MEKDLKVTDNKETVEDNIKDAIEAAYASESDGSDVKNSRDIDEVKEMTSKINPSKSKKSDEGEDDSGVELAYGPGSIYENSEERYKDNLSTSITFLICGVVGLTILLLNDFGVFHFLEKSNSLFYLINAVLIITFGGFIIIGIVSFRTAKRLKSKVGKEKELLDEIIGWVKDNITEEDIENSYNNDIPEEMKYFCRNDYLKNSILNNFPHLTEELASQIADTYIEETFN
ncbi:MAG: hypothetical protein ACI4E1_13265 [Lachnospira sp.]